MIPNATALTLHASYAWGLDLSGSAQGAGGVGGLLFVRNHNTASATATAPTYDGNGNITAYINLTNGQVTQRFEYDAFGNGLSFDSQLSNSTALSFRFSTKYTDPETNLLYYGYRYLSPELGRWLNRDPIGDRGGFNLIAMVENGLINQWDLLGLSPLMVPACDSTIKRCLLITQIFFAIHPKYSLRKSIAACANTSSNCGAPH
jgi:RHS repeat-associated protein